MLLLHCAQKQEVKDVYDETRSSYMDVSAVVGSRSRELGQRVALCVMDTLTWIAQRCNTTVETLLEANPIITDCNSIYVGQSLAVSVVPAPDLAQTYVVKAGDTLTGIAFSGSRYTVREGGKE